MSLAYGQRVQRKPQDSEVQSPSTQRGGGTESRGQTLGEEGRTGIGGGLGGRAGGPGPGGGADLKKRREPPPAATVLMSSWGAWRVTPAVLASKTCSNSPA